MPHIDDTQIATTAYSLWLSEGRPQGRDLDHWMRARAALETAAKPKTRRAAKPKTDAVTPKPRKAKTAAAKKPRAS